jgi:hypothetical protein
MLLYILTSVVILHNRCTNFIQCRDWVILPLFTPVYPFFFSSLTLYIYIEKRISVWDEDTIVKIGTLKHKRSTLNSGQIKVLELVYKYRFVSRQLLAGSLGVKPENGLYEKLEILVNHGYLGKRLELRKSVENVTAAYYLTPQGLKYLQALPDHAYISQPAFQESYRDKTIVGNGFISHRLNLYRQTQALQKQYPDLRVFTPRDMSKYRYFPKRLPDAFLSLESDNPEQPHRFFFDIVRDRQPSIDLVHKLTNYIEFFDDGGWEETESELPKLLLLCEWSPSERSIQRTVRKQLSRLDSNLQVYTSTVTAVTNTSPDGAVWTATDDEDEVVSLHEM